MLNVYYKSKYAYMPYGAYYDKDEVDRYIEVLKTELSKDTSPDRLKQPEARHDDRPERLEWDRSEFKSVTRLPKCEIVVEQMADNSWSSYAEINIGMFTRFLNPEEKYDKRGWAEEDMEAIFRALGLLRPSEDQT